MENNLYPSLRSALTTQHQTIAQIISGLSTEQLQKRAESNKWSIHENIAHLTTYQPVFYSRVILITEKENPSFERYSADGDPEFIRYSQKNIQELLNQIEKDRNRILSFLDGLSENSFSRTGLHPKYGKLNVVEWIEFFLLHEAHHIFTTFQLRHGAI